jgi:hypothetical protein
MRERVVSALGVIASSGCFREQKRPAIPVVTIDPVKLAAMTDEELERVSDVAST